MKIKPLMVMVLLSVCTASAQPKPEQIDEYTKVGCEDVLARTEMLGQRLKSSPSSRSVVVQFNRQSDWPENFVHRVLIAYFGNGLDVTFYRAHDNGDARTEVWLVPSGAAMVTNRFSPTITIPFSPNGSVFWDRESPDPCSGRTLLSFIEILKTSDADGRIVLVNSVRLRAYLK
ncbi:MAG: hypothetical protein H0X08_04060 [Blastocatellia bacterium]|nr:hypothetical protein [Blastocatellia bacterium]